MPKRDDLAKKYNGFQKPLVMIKVNGVEIDKETLLINKVTCGLTAGYEASYCSMEIEAIGNVYEDGKGLKLNDKIDVFELGSKLEISMGYYDKSTLKLVFVGYVTKLEFNYDNRDRTIYQIEAMDCKTFMMDVRRSEAKSDVKKFTDGVVSVLDKYSQFYDDVDIEPTKDELTKPLEQFNESDYEFIVKIAKKINYLFFIINNKVIFKHQLSLKENCLTVSPGPHLTFFKRRITLNEQIKKVKVINNDEKDPTNLIVGSAEDVAAVGKGSKGATEVSKVISGDMEKTIIDHEATSVAIANTRAKAELEALSMRFATGEFEIVGIPDVEPGKFVTVDLLEKKYNNDYFVTQVTHEYNHSKFTTVCKFNANKI